MYSPDVGYTLVSVRKLDDKGFKLTFSGGRCTIRRPMGEHISAVPKARQGLYRMAHDVMEQSLVLSHLILSTMPLPSYQMNYPTLRFDCVMEQPLSPLSYLFDLINYASLILLNKLSILFHPIIVWSCGRYYKVQGWTHI